jgi:hypothetical protein
MNPACLDHGLHALRRTVLQKCGRDVNCSLDYGRPVSKEFQHPPIQTTSNKSAPANRKTGFYANCDPNKQEVEYIFAWSSSEL